MKTIGQVVDKVDRLIGYYTERGLNPDRASFDRENELHRRQELVRLRDFICREGTE